MSAASVIAGAVQLAGGVAAAPLLPGLIQHVKARLQGRPGPSIVQPYRELRRLWRRRGVAPAPRTAVYELAPAIVAASALLALVLLPIGGRSPHWPFGHDALVLVGLLALFGIVIAGRTDLLVRGRRPIVLLAAIALLWALRLLA